MGQDHTSTEDNTGDIKSNYQLYKYIVILLWFLILCQKEKTEQELHCLPFDQNLVFCEKNAPNFSSLIIFSLMIVGKFIWNTHTGLGVHCSQTTGLVHIENDIRPEMTKSCFLFKRGKKKYSIPFKFS